MRLFIATSFPEVVTRDLNRRVSAIRSLLPAAGWVRPEAQHLTFAFLGEQKEAIIDQIAPLVTEAVAALPRFEATLRGSGFFPNPRHARVGWVGVEPEAGFVSLAKAVRGAVTTAGVELDRGDFRPHLTLMRIRDPWPPASIERFNSTLRDFRSEAFVLDHVTLFSSKLQPGGAVHTAIREFVLAG